MVIFFTVSSTLKSQEANVWCLWRPIRTKDMAEISARKAKRTATQVKDSEKEKAGKIEKRKEREIFLRRRAVGVNTGT